MRFVGALDAILIVRQHFDHFKNTTWRVPESSTWHIPTGYRYEGNDISELEFAGRHRFIAFPRRITASRQLNPVDGTLTGANSAKRPDPRREPRAGTCHNAPYQGAS